MSRSSLALVSALLAADPTPPPAPPIVSPTQEVVLGKEAVARYIADRPESGDAALAERVDGIGRKVAGHTERPGTFHRAIVVEGRELQAVAFPGGTVAVTEALARAFDDDELAFALGHEMAHVDLRHHVDRPALEDTVRSAAGAMEARIGSALSMEDRRTELEADRFGALYSVRSGFAFSASGRALRKLQEAGPDQDAKHPEFADRIQALKKFEVELRRALEAFDRGCVSLKESRYSEAVDYFVLFVASFPGSASGRINLGASYLARWRAGRERGDDLEEPFPVLADPGVTVRAGFDALDARNARDHFETAIRLDPRSAAARIGIAMVLTSEGKKDDAMAALRPVLDDPRLAPEAMLFLGNVAYREGSWRVAAQRYEEALRARPDWSAPRENLARALDRERRTPE